MTKPRRVVGVAGEDIEVGDLVCFHEDGRLYKIPLREDGNPAEEPKGDEID